MSTCATFLFGNTSQTLSTDVYEHIVFKTILYIRLSTYTEICVGRIIRHNLGEAFQVKHEILSLTTTKYELLLDCLSITFSFIKKRFT